MCHLGGGFGRNGNGPQAEQAIMIANANRGTPIHLLWTREEDFIGTTYRAMGMARLKAALDADGWPLALEVRTSMQQDGFGPDASFDVASRYYVPNYRFSNHTTNFHVPVGTRRGVGQAAHEFYRESFIDELAHAAGKDPYRYRRELIARTELPFKADMLKALDMAAEMSGWGTPLPRGTARAIALEERGAETGNSATISAMVHTVSVSRDGPRQARARRRRARVGLRLGQSAVGQEADRRPDHVVLQRRDAPGLQHRGRRDRREQLRHVLAVAHRRGSAVDQHRVFPDGALARRHGPRPRHVGASCARRRDFPDHGQALPRLAASPTRPALELALALKWLWKGVWRSFSSSRSRSAGLGYRAWRQHEGEALMRIAAPNGIDDALFVEIGGAQQWVTIRGQDRDNPVVLVLHGGPGSAIGRAWRPRSFPGNGTSRSCSGTSPARAERSAPRGAALRPISRSRAWRRTASSSPSGCGGRLGKDKIILLGWSWGSILGVHMVKARPDLFAA